MLFKKKENKNIDFILTRESVRNYSDKLIDKVDLDLILKAAMSGPTCLNSRDYKFIVVDEKKVLRDLYMTIGPTSKPLLSCTCAIVILADKSRSFAQAPDYRFVDTAIAAQNIMLAANALNIGSCMLGVYPQKDRVENVSKYFNLPSNLECTSVISLGYKLEVTKGKDHFEKDRIYYNKY
jgi:nitroreductase